MDTFWDLLRLISLRMLFKCNIVVLVIIQIHLRKKKKTITCKLKGWLWIWHTFAWLLHHMQMKILSLLQETSLIPIEKSQEIENYLVVCSNKWYKQMKFTFSSIWPGNFCCWKLWKPNIKRDTNRGWWRYKVNLILASKEK